MRLPTSAHSSQPWRIHELTKDFRTEDVWALPTSGDAQDFPLLVDLLASYDPARSSSLAVRGLFAVRWKLGGLLGWDRPSAGLGARVSPLRDRLPDDLRRCSSPRLSDEFPFAPLYVTEREWALEIANQTVHGVLHLGWVPDGADYYRGQMAVLVKRNGPLGAAYMAAIAPFRYLVVYPAMMRDLEREWCRRTAGRDPVHA